MDYSNEKEVFKMKKILSILIAVLLFVSALCLNVSAEAAEAIDVYVSISDKGTLKMSAEKISVADKDADGTITIDEALYAAHDKFYEGGSAVGYQSGSTAYGISIFKLWGDTSGSFGYYKNNASAMSLADTVQSGDYVMAYVYSDATTWSDTYTFFDKTVSDIERGEEVTLVLKESGYDQNWNTVVTPMADATITINGEDTEYKTDSEGKVTLKFDKGGKYVVSAKTASKVIVPPVCVITAPVEEEKVEEKTEEKTETPKTEEKAPEKETASPKTSDNVSGYALVALISSVAVAIILKKNAFYEK